MESTETGTCCYDGMQWPNTRPPAYKAYFCARKGIICLWGVIRLKSEITVRNIWKPPLFQDFSRPSHNRFGRTFIRWSKYPEWCRRTRLWRWFRQPRTGSSWSSPGTTRGQPALALPFGREKSPLGQYLEKRWAGEIVFLASIPLKVLEWGGVV